MITKYVNEIDKRSSIINTNSNTNSNINSNINSKSNSKNTSNNNLVNYFNTTIDDNQYIFDDDYYNNDDDSIIIANEEELKAIFASRAGTPSLRKVLSKSNFSLSTTRNIRDIQYHDLRYLGIIIIIIIIIILDL